jgi:hypothetical protein
LILEIPDSSDDEPHLVFVGAASRFQPKNVMLSVEKTLPSTAWWLEEVSFFFRPTGTSCIRERLEKTQWGNQPSLLAVRSTMFQLPPCHLLHTPWYGMVRRTRHEVDGGGRIKNWGGEAPWLRIAVASRHDSISPANRMLPQAMCSSLSRCSRTLKYFGAGLNYSHFYACASSSCLILFG